MSITLILIILTSGISIYAWSHPDLLDKWIFHPFSIYKKNQWYRFITSGFLHADWTHLFFNMLSLYFFGEALERVFMGIFGFGMGVAAYLLIYLGGMVVADIATYIKHKKDYDYRALGASGAVSAAIFASILFNPLNSICLFAFICMPGFIFGFVYLIYSYYQAQRMSGVNHSAHFYGAVFGFVVSLLLLPGAGLDFIKEVSGWRIF
jgi:membrane associated rhomboid family serine protease